MEEDWGVPTVVSRKKQAPAGGVVAWALSEIEVVEAELASTARQLWLLQRVCSVEHGIGKEGGRIEREGNSNFSMVRRVKAEEKLKLRDMWQTGKAL